MARAASGRNTSRPVQRDFVSFTAIIRAVRTRKKESTARARTMAKDSGAARLAPMPTISPELVDLVEAAVKAERRAEDARPRGERSSPLFFFALSLRPHLAELSESEAVDLVGKILTMRHPAAPDPWAAAFPNYLHD